MQPMLYTPLCISMLPIIIVVVVIVRIVGLIVIGMLLSRRVTLTVRTGGGLALTLASIILLSGLWCMFLSPTAAYSETEESFHRQISIGGLTSWSHSLSVQEGETIDGSVDGIMMPNFSFHVSGNSAKAFNLYVYDQNNDVVWSETNVTQTHFSIRAPSSGVYKIEIRNPNPQNIECYTSFFA